MRTQIAAGNWKMNLSFDQGKELVQTILQGINSVDLAGKKVIFSPPYPYLASLVQMTSGQDSVLIAAQNVHQEEKGAYTGEISASMLASIGVDACLVGHSERREYFQEANDLLAIKVNRLLDVDITPIYCLGEKLAEREGGETLQVIEKQMNEGVFGLEASAFSRLIIAYEPVWAIGTGKTASPEQAQEVHQFIRQLIATAYSSKVAEECTILYGGSVKPANADGLFSQPDIDGGLVGGASLKGPDFVEIIKAL